VSAAILGTDLQGLPQLTTSLIGRDALIERVVAVLSEERVRLVTLVGPGGIGKTRVSIAIADAVRQAVPDRVAFVPLAATPSPELVANTLAAALGVDGAGDAPLLEQIADRLRDRAQVLVIDNFEHLLEAAPIVSRLLAETPDLTVLATSRSPLRLSGEWVVSVPPLALPAADDDLLSSPAVQLFLDRSNRIDAETELAAGELERIAAICRGLDGLPLAIELAAANESATVLPGSRFPDDDAFAREIDPAEQRQRTMSSTVAWSYDLLSPAERSLLRRLSGFTGGCSVDAIAAISAELDGQRAGDPVDLLVALIDQSLVLPLFEAHGDVRGSMLQTISEFGREELEASAESSAFFAAHARWFLDFAERAEPGLRGADQLRWVQLIDADLGNIRTAIEWFRGVGDIESALRLTSAIGWYWSSPGHFHEGRDLYDRLLATAPASIAPDVLGKALEGAGDIEDWLMNLPKAQERYEEAAAVCRRSGDVARLASLTRGLGSIALGRGEYDRAAELFSEAIESSTAANNRWNYAAATNLLGSAHFARGAYDEAVALCTRATETWEALGDPGHVVAGASTTSAAALAGGRFALARERAAFTLAETDRLNDDWYRARLIAIAGSLLVEAGRHGEGLRLLAFSEVATNAIGAPLFAWISDLYERFKARARQALGDVAFADSWRVGSEFSVEEAMVEATSALVSLETAWPAASDRRPALSRRELEVLALLAQGKTDREIADDLFVERRTVSKHVAAILVKLGVSNRSAAASTALRLGLV
jgi:predicted ATPase/DNA-binding CsgD family transcriptional regulator